MEANSVVARVIAGIVTERTTLPNWAKDNVVGQETYDIEQPVLGEDGEPTGEVEIVQQTRDVIDGTRPLTDAEWRAEGYYPLEDVRPEFDPDTHRLEKLPVSQWSVGESVVSITYQPVQLTSNELAIRLAAARSRAPQSICEYADSALKIITGFIPQTEMTSWATKEMAARRYLAGEATELDDLILDSEISVTGEPKTPLCDSIVAHANAYRAIAGRIAGIRRVGTSAALTASAPSLVDAQVAAAVQAIDAIVAAATQ